MTTRKDLIDYFGLGTSWRLLVLVPALALAVFAGSLTWGLVALIVTVGVVLAIQWARGTPPKVAGAAALLPLFAWIGTAWVFAQDGASVDDALVEAPALIAFGLGACLVLIITRRAPK